MEKYTYSCEGYDATFSYTTMNGDPLTLDQVLWRVKSFHQKRNVEQHVREFVEKAISTGGWDEFLEHNVGVLIHYHSEGAL